MFLDLAPLADNESHLSDKNHLIKWPSTNSEVLLVSIDLFRVSCPPKYAK